MKQGESENVKTAVGAGLSRNSCKCLTPKSRDNAPTINQSIAKRLLNKNTVKLDKPAVDPSLPARSERHLFYHGSFGVARSQYWSISGRFGSHERQPVHFYQRDLEPLWTKLERL